MRMAEENEDLPLMSNVGEVLVRHYRLDLVCDFEAKRFTCNATLFLEPVPEQGSALCFCSSENNTAEKNNLVPDETPSDIPGFVFVLDCHKIEVIQVIGLNLPQNDLDTSKFSVNPPPCGITSELKFSVTKWALKIWSSQRSCKLCFPKAVQISYTTLPSCPSLLWVEDQLGKPAVFTHGAWVNNRSLFPCQEPPVAMATWEAVVTVTDSATVLMSGDQEPIVTFSQGCTKHYFYTKKPLPMSTLCLAVGFWEGREIHLEIGPKCRLFACSNLLDAKDFSEYIPRCVSAAEDILGPYPFPRIDFLIVPPTFGSLGMASPNVVFLSQSLLAGCDSSMLSRVAHEVVHGWFGLSIGAMDWTEEWLSEGFATFLEDFVHTRATDMLNSDVVDYLELKAFLRKKILSYEIENTSEELQVLRLGTEADVVEGMSAAVVKNGQNPLKAFTQVHYIKGYFLLRYLCGIIGTDAFLEVLKKYVLKFEGRLVTSQEFLDFLFNMSPKLKSTLSVENIYKNWLHHSGMPMEIENLKPSSHNKLFSKVFEETEKWTNLKSPFSKKKSKRRKLDIQKFSILTPEQTILLLENLLEEQNLSTFTLKTLSRTLDIKNMNAEVLHRWFELVVKYKMKSEYAVLKEFLINHLALGVYLYGEMIHSENAELRKMAENCFLRLRPQMEPNYISTIEGMLQ